MTPHLPAVITFYSYKGGVGRTMLAANMGVALAQTGKTLIWDLDAEAPGLHCIRDLRAVGQIENGFFNWLLQWQEHGSPQQLSEALLAEFTQLICPSRFTNLAIMPALGDKAIAASLYHQIDWRYLLQGDPDIGRDLFNGLLAHLDQLGYHHVLLDSRTGLTDLAGLITWGIADATVLVGGYGAQNLRGLAQIRKALLKKKTSESMRKKDADLQLFYVASPIPQDDPSLVAAGRKMWAEAFGLELASVQEIRYEYSLPFSEKILINDQASAVSQDYQRFASELLRFVGSMVEGELITENAVRERADIFGLERGMPQRSLSFAQRVAELLQLLGYTVEPEKLVDGMPVDVYASIEFGVDTISYLVECKPYRGSVPQRALEQLAHRLSLAQARSLQARGMVVAETFSPAGLAYAKEQGLQAYTPQELERKLLDVGPYIHSIIADFEQQALASAYVTQHAHPGVHSSEQLAARRDSGKDEKQRITDLTAHGIAWARGTGSRLWVLLGDYGTGKTAYTQKLEYELAKMAREDSESPVPLRINLRDFPNKVSLDDVLAEHWLRATKQRKDPKVLLHLVQSGRLVLLLDSFDEMGLATAGRSVVEQFRSLAQVCAPQDEDEKTTARRVLITCREQFFRDHGEASQAANISALHGVALSFAAAIDTVAMFSPAQIAEFLRKRLGEKGGAQALAFLQAQNLLQLGDRPQLLDIIIQSLPALKEREARGGLPLSSGALYQIYTDKWLDDFKPVERQSSSAQLRMILEVLSHILWQREGNRIHYGDLYALLKNRSDLRGKLDPNQLDIELRTAAFLSRTPDGMYGFSHRSFLEFFFARRIARAAASDELAQVLEVSRLSREICAFVADLLPLREECEILRSALHHLLTNPDAALAARANGLWLAYLIEAQGVAEKWLPDGAQLAGVDVSSLDLRGLQALRADFSGANLEDALLQGALLTGAKLCQAKLARADLRDVQASNTDWQLADCNDCLVTGIHLQDAQAQRSSWVNVDFAGADLAGADFSQADLTATRWLGAHGENVVAAADLLAALRGDAATPARSQLHAQARAGHDETVISVAYSPDGKRIATASIDGWLRVWDSKTGRLLARLWHGWPWQIAFSPDGRFLASAGGGMVQVWDAQRLLCLQSLPDHRGGFLGVGFSATCQQLITVDEVKLRFWSWPDWQLVQAIEHQKGRCHAFAFSGDGGYLAMGEWHDQPLLWNLHSKQAHRIEQDLGYGLALNSNGSDLALATPEGAFLQREGRDSASIAYPAFTCAFSPDDTQLLLGGSDGRLALYEVQSQKILQHVAAHQDTVRSLAFSPDGQYYLSGAQDKAAQVLSTQTGKRLRQLGRAGVGLCHAAWNDKGGNAVFAHANACSVWDVRQASLTCQLAQRSEHVAMQGDSAAFWHSAGAALHKTASDGQPLQSYPNPKPDGEVVVGKNGSHFAVRQFDTVRVHSTENGQEVGCFSAQENRIGDIYTLAPDGSLLAASVDGSIYCWQVNTGALLHKIATQHNYIHQLQFSPDGLSLASACHDGSIGLWDVASGQNLGQFTGHTDAVSSLAFSADGRILASGSYDNTICLWQVSSRELLASFPCHHGFPSQLGFTDDGNLFVVGSDGGLHLYTPPSATQRAAKLLLSLFVDNEDVQGAPGEIIPPERCSWYSVDYRQDARGLWRGNGAALDLLRYRDTTEQVQPYPWLPKEWRARDLPQLRAPDERDIFG